MESIFFCLAPAPAEKAKEQPVDAEEMKRQLRAEKKRLRQITELAEKAAAGEALNADQTAKLARRAEVEALVAQLETSCSL